MTENTQVEDFGYKQELKRELSFFSIIFYGMAMLLPIAPVPVYGSITIASNGHMALAYLLALIPMSFTAFSYGTMAGKYPLSGSSYTYISKSINNHLGFLSGWVLLLDYALFPVLNYICIALYTQQLFPQLSFKAIIIVSVVVITAINLMGIKDLSLINTILTIFGFLVIGYFIVTAFGYIGNGNGTGFSTTAIYNPKTFSFNALMLGASVACFSFVGFDTMTTLAEEVKNPKKVFTKATLIVCFSMGILFTITAFFAQASFPDISKFTNIDVAFIDVANAVGGQTLVTLISCAMIAGAFAFSLDAQAGVARLLYGMGRDGVLPKRFFTYIHPKTKVPVYSTIMIGVICIALSEIDINTIFPMINFGGLTAYILVNISVIARFYIRDKNRGFSNFIKYVILPGLGAITCLILWISLSIDAKIVGGCWGILGFIYLICITKFFKKPLADLKM